MAKRLIGITGLKGSGKDTAAAILVGTGHYQRGAFADALKWEVYAASLLATLDCRLGIESKTFLAYLEEHKRDDVSMETGWVRPLLQGWGVMRRGLCGDDYWVKQAPLHHGYVISDVRFPSEERAIHAAGGIMWRIERPPYRRNEEDRNASEIQVAKLPVDYLIVNDGSLDDLRVKVLVALANVDNVPDEGNGSHETLPLFAW